MKAVVISDSHRNFNSIIRIMEKEADAEVLIHAGDVQQDVDDMESVWDDKRIEYVLGNNDRLVWGVPFTRIFDLFGKKVFLTHGHMFGVKGSPARVIAEAKKVGADICIFGHTHNKFLENRDGMWVLNPGSSYSSYAVIEKIGDEIKIEIKEN